MINRAILKDLGPVLAEDEPRLYDAYHVYYWRLFDYFRGRAYAFVDGCSCCAKACVICANAHYVAQKHAQFAQTRTLLRRRGYMTWSLQRSNATQRTASARR